MSGDDLGTPPPPLAPLPASGHCDCHTVHPTDLRRTSALVVYAPTAHLRLRLSAAAAAHDVLLGLQPDAVLVHTDLPEQLRALLGTFTLVEQPELLAVPSRDGVLQVAEIAPLGDWAERLSTPWFGEASRHLCFHYQPIVTCASGQVFGYEALVRAQLGGQLIGAGPLLSAASAHRQARAFDALARQTAIRQGYPLLSGRELLFLNFAPGVVYNPDICLQTTFRACREVGADFSRLVFEVTESERFPDLKLLHAILSRYRAEGARVALDDLGAGHTSLTFLSSLRPDIVKLDRGLMQGLTPDDPRHPLVLALIRYAHDLGIEVIAEGIETPEELAVLRELGADHVQGYLLGRPAPRPLQRPPTFPL